MTLSGENWKSEFIAAKGVNAKCDILDQTSNTIFNTLTSEIIAGFFTFGSTWGGAIGRTICNWWVNAKRYRNLHALWQDVTDTAKSMNKDLALACKAVNVEDEKTIKLIGNCIRLTLALCARTYQQIDERGRWNSSIRTDAYAALLNTKINNQKWFDFLATNIPSIKGLMNSFLTARDAKELNQDLKKRISMAESVKNKEEIVKSNEEFNNFTNEKSTKNQKSN